MEEESIVIVLKNKYNKGEVLELEVKHEDVYANRKKNLLKYVLMKKSRENCESFLDQSFSTE
jgi:hypothetical protein